MIAKVLRRLTRAVYLAADDVVMRVDLAAFDVERLRPKLAPGVGVRALTPDDLGPVAAALGAHRAALYRERLAGGAIGVLATYAGLPAGAAWMSYEARAGEGEPPFTFTVKPKAETAYLFDSFVLPEHRGLGLGTVLKHALLAQAKADDKAIGWSVHDGANVAILKVCAKLGHVACGTLRHRRIFGVVRLDLAALADLTRP
jgi:GNAT superfamily N-acetyltransferase